MGNPFFSDYSSDDNFFSQNEKIWVPDVSLKSSLSNAASMGLLDLIEQMIDNRLFESGGKMTFSYDFLSLPLSAAIKEGHFDIVKYFVDLSNPKPRGYYSLIAEALKSGHADIVKYFVALDEPKAINYYYLLIEAVQAGNILNVKALLPHVDPKECQSAALALASQKGRRDIFELLYPLSDPWDAYSLMSGPRAKEGFVFAGKDFDLLNEYLKMEEERGEILKSVLGVYGEKTYKKKRKI